MGRKGRGVRLAASSIITAVAVVASGPAAWAHDAHQQAKQQGPVLVGPLQAALPGAMKANVKFAPPTPGHPQGAPFGATLTNLPTDPSVSYPSPTDACDPASCAEMDVTVPAGSKTLYGSIGWDTPSYSFVLFALSPDKKIYGRVGDTAFVDSEYTATDTNDSYDKDVGNQRTIPRAQFTLADPKPGNWIIRARAVWANKTAFSGVVAVSADAPVQFARTGVRELADQYATQPLRVSVVVAGRTLSKAQAAALRANLPDQYRTAVLEKAFADGNCGDTGAGGAGPRQDGPIDCSLSTLANWHGVHYSGTEHDAKGDQATGRVPYFEPIKFSYSYRFFQADDVWTNDLFATMAKSTKKNVAWNEIKHGSRHLGQGGFMPIYNATRGTFRGADALVANPNVADKIDPFPVEDWIFNSRNDPKYAHSFKDVEANATRDGRFIDPDPGAYLDPFYTARSAPGTKNLDRMPQGASTSVTYFAIDTFTSKLARKYFPAGSYHVFDVSNHFPDPDTGEADGPDYARQWGGRYRFYMLDLGAAPNNYESTDGFTNSTPTDSGSFPDGDPPIWEMLNNPVWAPFETTFTTKLGRDVAYGLFFRFTAPYLYRPRPADVYLVANNNWSDYYSRPAPEGGGGVAYTDLTKVYHPDFVSKNLGAALPGATFVTESAFPKVKTFRYLGCSTERAGYQTALLSPSPSALVPDPTCHQGDKIQHALEVAKSQGDDVVGAGNNGATVSASVVRAFVEQNREDIAPFRPGLFTVTNVSVVFPGAMTWDLPAIVGGVAFGTPDGEAWGVLNNTNDRVKGTTTTDCKKSPAAPGCTPGSPQVAGSGFTYTIEHESSHFLGLLHPHDSLVVDKDANGQWNYYREMYYSAGDFSQAPTTYAGAFAPYSVLDQDIIQRGHIAEYLRMAQDWIADAYQSDGIVGLSGRSLATALKELQMNRWRALGSRLFSCGDYLHAEYAMRNAYLSAQGVFGPVVEPRLLQPGERVLFAVHPQAVYGPDGPLPGCAATSDMARSLDEGALAGLRRLPATGSPSPLPFLGLGLVAFAAWVGRRRRVTV